MGYDPGSDPVPEPMGTPTTRALGRETVEERLPLLGAEDEVLTKTDAGTDPAAERVRARRAETSPAAPGSRRCWRSS